MKIETLGTIAWTCLFSCVGAMMATGAVLNYGEAVGMSVLATFITGTTCWLITALLGWAAFLFRWAEYRRRQSEEGNAG